MILIENYIYGILIEDYISNCDRLKQDNSVIYFIELLCMSFCEYYYV